MTGPKRFAGNYITNLSLDNASGGWNGMNAALFGQLSQHFSLKYVGPINPRPALFDRIQSKLQRLVGFNPAYHFFADKRLHSIAQLVESQRETQSHFDYFHGITPWIRCSTKQFAYAYTDACFATYYDTYHQSDRFSAKSRHAIERQERRWLLDLKRVFFSSRYALEECRQRYQLDGPNFETVGLGAAINAPIQDTYTGGYKLLFIAVDFARKGGEVCFAAFRKFHRLYPEATLTFIGAQPPREVLEWPGVSWAGFLSKENPSQLKQLERHLASAFALVLPTVSDMTPLVVAEAALFGCPTVAPRAFGIPEMIEDGQTGRLLSMPPRSDEFAQALQQLADDEQAYRQMRANARRAACSRFTWESVSQRVASAITQDLTSMEHSKQLR